MELDQLQKRLEWLENEHRKDKTIIATLEERVAAAEGSLPDLQTQVKDLTGEVVRLTTMLARFDQLDAALSQQRVELTRALETAEKLRLEREREFEKVRSADIDSLNKALAEVRKGLDPIPDLKKAVQARVEEEYRLGRLIESTEVKLVEGRRTDEEYRRAQKLLEEGQRQDAKRLADLQGEVTAMRKRLDEQRGKVDLVADTVRKTDARITDLQTAEGERRSAQTTFIDKQNMAFLERERIWKEWQARFEVIERQAAGLDNQLQALETTQRAVRRAQDSFEEITQRFERRINEITEMQRLTEERYRQEWVAFRADDQKRWTNYSLAQEEQLRDQQRRFDRADERVTTLEDRFQDIQDVLQQINADTQKRLQTLLAVAHSWMEEYDRVLGRSGG